MARKLTDEQEAEVVRRYEAGEPAVQLAVTMSVSPNTIGRVLDRHNCPRRSAEKAAHLRDGIEDIPSPGRLRELYFGKDKPSVNAMASRFEVSWNTMAKWLAAASVQKRTPSEQFSSDIRMGRKPIPSAHFSTEHRSEIARRACACHSTERIAKFTAGGNTKQARAKAGIGHRRRITRPCGWCGSSVERKQSAFDKCDGRVCCSITHRNLFISHQCHHKTESRPLIFDRLCELMAQAIKRGLPPDEGTLAKVGEPIGVGPAEIAAYQAMQDHLREAEMLRAWERTQEAELAKPEMGLRFKEPDA